MEFLVDLLPLLALYVVARMFTRRRRTEQARVEPSEHVDADAAAREPDLADLLRALGMAPPEPAPVPSPPPPEPSRPSRSRDESTSRRRNDSKFTARPRPPAPAASDVRSVFDGGHFEASDFVEGGPRRARAAEAPSLPVPGARIVARLRDPEAAREAFVMQMLLERRRPGRPPGRR